MVEYIEREAAIVRACKAIQDDFIAFDVKEAIKAIPAADVRPVVLCKFCRSQRWCNVAQFLGNDGYCSRGEYATNCGADMREETK